MQTLPNVADVLRALPRFPGHATGLSAPHAPCVPGTGDDWWSPGSGFTAAARRSAGNPSATAAPARSGPAPAVRGPFGPGMADRLPHDPSMPGLSALWDPQAGSALVASELKRAGRDVGGEPALDTIHHRPGQRAVTLFALRGDDDAPTGWCTAFTWADRSARGEHRRLSRPADAEGAGPGWLLLDSLNTVLQLFPCDRQLPGLASIYPTLPDSVAGALLEEYGWDSLDYCLAPRYYRPGRAYVQEAQLVGPGPGQHESVTLRYAHGMQGSAAFQRGMALARSVELAGRDVRIRAPSRWLPEHNLLLFRRAPGVAMSELLAGGRLGERHMERLAEALLDLQSVGSADVVSRSLAGERAAERELLELVRWACPELNGLLDALERRLRQTHRVGRPLLCHCDVSPGRVFFDDAAVTLTGIDGFAKADRFTDVSRLAVRLAMACDPQDGARSLGLARHLFGAYAAALPGRERRRARRSLSLAILRIVQSQIRHQIPGWRERCHRLLEESLLCLDRKDVNVPALGSADDLF